MASVHQCPSPRYAPGSLLSSLVTENTGENGNMTESYIDEWVLDSSDQTDSDG